MDVSCKICNKTLSYDTQDVFVLGEHLVKDHPENCVSHYFFENDEGDGLRNFENAQKCGGDSAINNDHKWSRKGTGIFNGRSDNSGATLYKTTVETWREGSMSVKCINCGVHSKPLLRKQRNKVAVTSLGAFWLHGCWPFCILPFISGKATGGIRAYCKYCGHFIGTYDRNTGQLTRKSASYSTTETLQQCEC